MSIREQLPPEIKSKLRYLYYLPIDTIDYLLGKRDELTPPRKLNLAGDGDFKEKGREVFRYFVDFVTLLQMILSLMSAAGLAGWLFR